MATKTKSRLTAIGSAGNGGKEDVETQLPYIATVTVEGTSAILFHAWNDDAVAEKAKAAKGSKAKKSDNYGSYVYRDDKNHICLPGSYLKGAIVGAARYRQDPRSPRKSGMDLFKAGVVPLTELAPIQTNGKPAKDWDYLDRRRVVVQRNAITRIRPAFLAGWKATIDLEVLTPEYIDQQALLDTIVQAGRLIGLADFRPTFGRFSVINYEVRTG